MVARPATRGKWGMTANGYGGFCDEENNLELDSDD